MKTAKSRPGPKSIVSDEIIIDVLSQLDIFNTDKSLKTERDPSKVWETAYEKLCNIFPDLKNIVDKNKFVHLYYYIN